MDMGSANTLQFVNCFHFQVAQIEFLNYRTEMYLVVVNNVFTRATYNSATNLLYFSGQGPVHP